MKKHCITSLELSLFHILQWTKLAITHITLKNLTSLAILVFV